MAVVALFLTANVALAEVTVVDDSGRSLTLAQPARRIISLAPHITELLFAAGAGDRVVGVIDFSNYPEAAKKITNIGSHALLDLERIVSLKPDLIVVWRDGNAQRQLEKLLSLGIPVYYSEPQRLEDIARSIEKLGLVAGTGPVAAAAAREFSARLAGLRARYAALPTVPVFYQIWNKPLMTVSGNHVISDVIASCGGRNIFADLKPLAPVIAEEAVIERDPEAIGGAAVDPKIDGFDMWRKWPRLLAVRRGNFFTVHPDLISRHTPRILDAAQALCEQLDAVRARRKGAP
ncbi:MAG: cobalamin-binding protein [Proteobacteria bacterium]|nr:cobalamin-binding protein [Pseudomonadota bacterium]